MSNTNGHSITRKELREELKKFATQENLDRTRESLDRTRESLDRTQESVGRLAREVGRLNSRVTAIEEQMLTRKDFDRIMKVLDGLATSSRQCWAKSLVHDQRIKALEDRQPK
ncbi:MAG: hypothetical protein IT452_12215 [Planctomycetia bacterium]|nr:hypothetical protein [Planctomycetia bacterium]